MTCIMRELGSMHHCLQLEVLNAEGRYAAGDVLTSATLNATILSGYPTFA